MKDNILVIDNFLSLDFCQQLVTNLKSTDTWEKNGDGIWHDRSINLGSITDHKDLETMLDLRIKVKNKISEYYKLTVPLYNDIFQFVRWRVGDKLEPPHADAEHIDGRPHPFFYRNYASIVYLNNDYLGGEIYFPTLNYRPKIKTGMLVSFPGTLEYLHGVSTVTEGTRYTIAGFFTFDKTYHDGRRI